MPQRMQGAYLPECTASHPLNSNIHSHSHETHKLFEIDIGSDNSVHWYPSVTLIEGQKDSNFRHKVAYVIALQCNWNISYTLF